MIKQSFSSCLFESRIRWLLSLFSESDAWTLGYIELAPEVCSSAPQNRTIRAPPSFDINTTAPHQYSSRNIRSHSHHGTLYPSVPLAQSPMTPCAPPPRSPTPRRSPAHLQIPPTHSTPTYNPHSRTEKSPRTSPKSPMSRSAPTPPRARCPSSRP